MEIVDGIHVLSGEFTNLFLIVDGGEAALVDAYWGASETDMLQTVSKIVDPKSINTVILTHGHPDHAGASPCLVEKTGATISAHVADAWMVECPSHYFYTIYQYTNPTRERYEHWMTMAGGRGVRVGRMLRNGDVITVGSRELEIVHTPGHSHGSVCILDRREKAFMTGDTPVPIEWISTWLGYVVDAGLYRLSLERMRSLKPEMLLQAHGSTRKGSEVLKELDAHIARYDLTEKIIYEYLSDEPKPLPEIRSHAVDSILEPRVLPWKEEDNPMAIATEWITVNSFLQKLCLEEKAAQDKNLKWRKI